MIKCKHEKTGNIYTIISDALMKVGDKKWIECIVYQNELNAIFVREKGDFNKKFTKI